MSEYEYVVFQAVDRPLNDSQLKYAQRQSTRADVSRWSLSVEYHYSSFRGDVDGLLRRGYDVLLETGGSLSVEDVPSGVVRIIDFKCPGSGESERNRWDNLDHLRAGDELKFVLADQVDYRWAAEQIRERALADRCPVLLSPVHGRLDAGELARWALRDRLPVRIQLQLHKLQQEMILLPHQTVQPQYLQPQLHKLLQEMILSPHQTVQQQ